MRDEVNQKISTVEAWLAERGKGHALAGIRSAMADLDDEEKSLALHVLQDEVSFASFPSLVR